MKKTDALRETEDRLIQEMRAQQEYNEKARQNELELNELEKRSVLTLPSWRDIIKLKKEIKEVLKE